MRYVLIIPHHHSFQRAKLSMLLGEASDLMYTCASLMHTCAMLMPARRYHCASTEVDLCAAALDALPAEHQNLFVLVECPDDLGAEAGLYYTFDDREHSRPRSASPRSSSAGASSAEECGTCSHAASEGARAPPLALDVWRSTSEDDPVEIRHLDVPTGAPDQDFSVEIRGPSPSARHPQRALRHASSSRKGAASKYAEHDAERADRSERARSADSATAPETPETPKSKRRSRSRKKNARGRLPPASVYLYKTALCRAHPHCTNAHCTFAHGCEELRTYRTRMCPNLGTCDGVDCQFAHSQSELREVVSLKQYIESRPEDSTIPDAVREAAKHVLTPAQAWKLAGLEGKDNSPQQVEGQDGSKPEAVTGSMQSDWRQHKGGKQDAGSGSSCAPAVFPTLPLAASHVRRSSQQELIDAFTERISRATTSDARSKVKAHPSLYNFPWRRVCSSSSRPVRA